MSKVIIYLRDNEIRALQELAQHEYRAPKSQAALIIHQELQRLGMIPVEPGPSVAEPALPALSEFTGNSPSSPVASGPVPHNQTQESEA
jgi:hypothetical protein